MVTSIDGVQLETSQFVMGDITWVVLQAGDGYPVVLQHGFPDTPHTFRHQIKALLDNGYRVILPYLPGYSPSEIGGGKTYNAARLGKDYAELIRRLGFQQVAFIGHDWGACAGLLLSAEAPELMRCFISAAYPHSIGFRAADAKQLWRSRYMLLFQLPGAAWWVRRNNFHYLHRLMAEWSPTWSERDQHLQPVIHCLQSGHSLRNALGYYRHILRQSLISKELHQAFNAVVDVPTLAVGGREDGCLGSRILENQVEGFGRDYRLHLFEGAGHFCHNEKPAEFNRAMLAFLAEKVDGDSCENKLSGSNNHV